jgi:hypothetical protein
MKLPPRMLPISSYETRTGRRSPIVRPPGIFSRSSVDDVAVSSMATNRRTFTSPVPEVSTAQI